MPWRPRVQKWAHITFYSENTKQKPRNVSSYTSENQLRKIPCYSTWPLRHFYVGIFRNFTDSLVTVYIQKGRWTAVHRLAWGDAAVICWISITRLPTAPTTHTYRQLYSLALSLLSLRLSPLLLMLRSIAYTSILFLVGCVIWCLSCNNDLIVSNNKSIT